MQRWPWRSVQNKRRQSVIISVFSLSPLIRKKAGINESPFSIEWTQNGETWEKQCCSFCDFYLLIFIYPLPKRQNENYTLELHVSTNYRLWQIRTRLKVFVSLHYFSRCQMNLANFQLLHRALCCPWIRRKLSNPHRGYHQPESVNSSALCFFSGVFGMQKQVRKKK